jgi:hypothetical protein
MANGETTNPDVRTSEARELATERAEDRRTRLITDLDELNAKLREKDGELPDSAPLIRQERDQGG